MKKEDELIIGYPYTYGDELKVEESSGRTKAISNTFITGFTKGFMGACLIYGVSRVSSAFAIC